ncbi:MAG: isoprenyl transferase [Crocinitomicaceae bacterium]|nr:isoprenyl transferase [Crocinitomicaceae bacterium]
MIDKTQINLLKVPQHIAIIMDGNGRWAKQQGEQRLFGHNVGVESVREVLKGAKELGVKYLTLYTFSTENWNRPKEEVDGLMDLLVKTIASEVQELHDSGVRLMSIGDIDGLPISCVNELKSAQEQTKENKDINLVLALNYSAKWEILNATKNIAKAVSSGKLKEENITDELFSSYLTTAEIPDPELLIRTSGESRLSNFLLWQCAYTEFYFTEVLWPDFKKEHLFEAVHNYQNRERRFGKVSEQLNTNI